MSFETRFPLTRGLVRVLVVASAVASGGCGGGSTPPCVVNGVTASVPQSQILVGATVMATASVSSTNCAATDLSPTWSSASSAIASVTTAGIVSGVAPGTTTITASAGGKSGSFFVTVTTVPVASVTLSATEAQLFTGQTLSLTATPKDAAGNVLQGRTVLWATPSPAVVSVNNGFLTALSPGGPVIVTATIDGVTAVANITVVAPVAMAYGVASTATPSAVYEAAEAFNGAGGPATVRKTALGLYEVTIPVQAASTVAPRYVYVGSRTATAVCHPAGAPVNSGAGALLIGIVCYSVTTGTAVDAPFAYIAFGPTAFFPGRLGFVATEQTIYASPITASSSPFTHSSRGDASSITIVGDAGGYTFTFSALARQAGDNPENIFVQSWNPAPGTSCGVGAWANSVLGTTAFCYDHTGAAVADRMGALLLERGRTNKRFALALVSAPGQSGSLLGPFGWTTGIGINATRLAAGVMDITFTNLGGAGDSPTIPIASFVSANNVNGSRAHCTVTQLTRVDIDIVVRTQCVSVLTGAGIDQSFTIALIE